MSFNHINSLGEKRKPFLVISDFKAKKINVIEISELEKYDIEFCIDENYKKSEHSHHLKKLLSHLMNTKKSLIKYRRE